MASDDGIEQTSPSSGTFNNVIPLTISTLSVLFFLYGIYIVIFGLSVQALSRRKGTVPKLYTGSIVTLFLLATIFTAIETWGQSRKAVTEFRSATSTESDNTPLFQNDDGMIVWNSILSIISCLMNAVTDSMLIHRCYIIWSFNLFVLYPLIFATVILNGCILAGIVGFTKSTPGHADSSLLLRVFSADSGVIMAILLFQIVLTLMTGARIWWISRQVRQLMGGPTPNSTDYAAIVAIIVESGLLYASTLLVLFIIEHVLDQGLRGEIALNVGVVVTLMSGIAPTLIIVRVAHGKSVDNVQQMMSTLRFTDAMFNVPEPNSAHRGFSGSQSPHIEP